METFREFYNSLQQNQFTDQEVVNMYFAHSNIPIREIARKTNKSIGEVYRILQRHQVSPNRRNTNHHNVLSLADSGMPNKIIADFTGYTTRQVRNILKRN